MKIPLFLVLGCGTIEAPPGKDAVVDTGPGETDTDTDTDTDTEQQVPPRWDVPFEEAHFAATHNSYSGEERGSILAQLEAGVRFLEFDIHDNDYPSWQSFRIGHGDVGDEVDSGGDNPSGYRLEDWLKVVADWSLAHPDHAPITVGLDLKDDLQDNQSYAQGNLAALNEDLEQAFGTRLFTLDGLEGDWPTVWSMRGRILVVLSGDVVSRKRYRQDPGHNPAVAMNDQGQVVEVHDSGGGDLWYWSGQLESDGRVHWRRHGKYGTGQTPAVALNNDGWIVEVHQSENEVDLWSHVGRLDSDYEPNFADSEKYDTGVNPTVRFDTADSNSLREIHTSEGDFSQNWYWSVTLDDTLSWGAHGETSDSVFDDQVGTSDAGEVQVSSMTHLGQLDTLLATVQGRVERIRYPQWAFSEYRRGDDSELADADTRFYGVSGGEAGQVSQWRAQGGVVRVWGFDEGDAQDHSTPPVFPATDTPFATWYQDYCASLSILE